MRFFITLFIFAVLFNGQALAAQPYPVGQSTSAVLGDVTQAPFGWIEFCGENPSDCPKGTTQPRDVLLSAIAWRELDRINRWVNHHIRPMTDMDHWGVVEKWSLPTDGYGDCEDYVLLKQKMLVDAGWPREALLITVVRDETDQAHVVLTVKSDRGEFILDNQYENVLTSNDTDYRFVKRQSQADSRVWLSIQETLVQMRVASH
jgi:predicted transglutaminase-like cysteine proteinase